MTSQAFPFTARVRRWHEMFSLDKLQRCGTCLSHNQTISLANKTISLLRMYSPSTGVSFFVCSLPGRLSVSRATYLSGRSHLSSLLMTIKYVRPIQRPVRYRDPSVMKILGSLINGNIILYLA